MSVASRLSDLAQLRHYGPDLRTPALRTLTTRRSLRQEIAQHQDWQALKDRGRWSDQLTAEFAHYWWGTFKERRHDISDYLELGSWEGQSVVLAGWLFPNAKLTAVDWFNNARALENFRHNTSPFRDRLTAVKQTSHEALIELQHERRWFDIIYLDADHRFDGTMLDSLLAWPLLRVGGYMIWDDYLWTHDALGPALATKPAIDAFLRTRRGRLEVQFADWQVCVRKTAPEPELRDMAETFTVV